MAGSGGEATQRLDPSFGRGSPLRVASDAYLRASTVVVQWSAMAVIAFMVALNATDITLRALVGSGFSWTQELSIILAMYLYFYAYALIAKEDGYIRVEFLVNRLPAVAQRWLDMGARLLVLAFQAVLAWLAIDTARFASLFETPVLGWPETVFFVPVVIGAIDICLTELIYLVRHLRGESAVRERRSGLLS